MWINPLSVHFGMITAGRMLGLRISDGAIVAGVPNPSTGRRTANRAGYFIHSAIVSSPCIYMHVIGYG